MHVYICKHVHVYMYMQLISVYISGFLPYISTSNSSVRFVNFVIFEVSS